MEVRGGGGGGDRSCHGNTGEVVAYIGDGESALPILLLCSFDSPFFTSPFFSPRVSFHDVSISTKCEHSSHVCRHSSLVHGQGVCRGEHMF